MNILRNVTLSTLLLAGLTSSAMAQLPDPIEPDPGVQPDWVTLGIASFDQVAEDDVHVGGWRARNLDMIAMQPLSADIECNNMQVSLADRTGAADFPLRYEGPLNEDWIYKIPLRGENRNVTDVDLTCRSVSGNRAIVQLYGIPDGVGSAVQTVPY